VSRAAPAATTATRAQSSKGEGDPFPSRIAPYFEALQAQLASHPQVVLQAQILPQMQVSACVQPHDFFSHRHSFWVVIGFSSFAAGHLARRSHRQTQVPERHYTPLRRQLAGGRTTSHAPRISRVMTPCTGSPGTCGCRTFERAIVNPWERSCRGRIGARAADARENLAYGSSTKRTQCEPRRVDPDKLSR
jgi:hypothetical protein